MTTCDVGSVFRFALLLRPHIIGPHQRRYGVNLWDRPARTEIAVWSREQQPAVTIVVLFYLCCIVVVRRSDQ